MTARPRYFLGVLTYLVLVPIGVVVGITAALLLGVEPRYVFFAGNALRAFMRALGLQIPNAVGVVSTGLFWWVLVLGIRYFISRSKGGAA